MLSSHSRRWADGEPTVNAWNVMGVRLENDYFCPKNIKYFNEFFVIIDSQNAFEYKKSCYRVIVEKCVFLIF